MFLYIAFLAVMSVLALRSFITAHRLIKLKKRCNVKVTAVCSRIDNEHGNNYRRRNAAWSYEYEGKNYTGNNSVWTYGTWQIFEPDDFNVGDRADIFIDPNSLPDILFDPFAQREISSSCYSGAACLIVALGCMSPFFASLII